MNDRLKSMRLLAVVFVFMIVPVASASMHDLMITGSMDATLTGGAPKVVELYTLTDVVDLSQYALSRAGNGNAAFDAIDVSDPNDLPSTLPIISLNTGDFYYAVGNSFSDMTSTLDTIFPSHSGIRMRHSAVNSNGDDVTGLFFDPSGMFA